VQVKHRLPNTGATEDHQAVLVEPGLRRRLGDEIEHPLVLVGRQLADVAERLDVLLGDDQQVDVGTRVDVLDREQPVPAVDDGCRQLAGVDLAEDAVRVTQQGSPPPTPPHREL